MFRRLKSFAYGSGCNLQGRRLNTSISRDEMISCHQARLLLTPNENLNTSAIRQIVAHSRGELRRFRHSTLNEGKKQIQQNAD
jgi:hypothetical protein